jgi:hypothetical protein
MNRSSSTKEFPLRIDPEEKIIFTRRGNSKYTGKIILVSSSMKKILYKVKTTRPDCYNVRPAVELLDAQKPQTILVTLLTAVDEAIQKHSADRFLVEFFEIDLQRNEAREAADLWKEEVRNIKPYQRKLQIAFDVPERPTSITPKENGTPTTIQSPVQNIQVIPPPTARSSFASPDRFTSPTGSLRRQESPPQEPRPRSSYNSNRDYNNNQYNEENSYASVMYDQQLNMSRQQDSFALRYYQSNYDPAGTDYKSQYDKWITKIQAQEKELAELKIEKDRCLTELTVLQDNIQRSRTPYTKAPEIDNGGFQLWHIVMVALASLIIGAFLSG